MGLSTIFCPRLSEEIYFHFLPFRYILVFQKTHSLFQLIFRDSEVPQILKINTFQEALFYTLASSTNLTLKVVPIGTAQKMRFFIKGFSSKCDQIRRKLPIWSHLLEKYLMENSIFCAV